jgi:hypothetical protein
MERTTLLVWVRVWDGTREVWPSHRYLTYLDLSPERTALAVARLNWLIHQAAVADAVHRDYGRYQLELIDFHTGEPVLRWLYAPEVD